MGWAVRFYGPRPGADVEQPGKDGATPLFVAGMNGFEECQLLLLRHGADEARNYIIEPSAGQRSMR
jgi:hypothetical protein